MPSRVEVAAVEAVDLVAVAAVKVEVAAEAVDLAAVAAVKVEAVAVEAVDLVAVAAVKVEAVAAAGDGHNFISSGGKKWPVCKRSL